jgi:hypothetical protein
MSAFRDQPLAVRIEALLVEVRSMEERLPSSVWTRLPTRKWSALMRATRDARGLGARYEIEPMTGEAFERALAEQRDALASALESADEVRAELAKVPDGPPALHVGRRRWRQRLGELWSAVTMRAERRESLRARGLLLEAATSIGDAVTPLETGTFAKNSVTFGCEGAALADGRSASSPTEGRSAAFLASTVVHRGNDRPFVVSELSLSVPRGAVEARARKLTAGNVKIEVPDDGSAERAMRELVREGADQHAGCTSSWKLRVLVGVATFTLFDAPDVRVFAAAARLLSKLRDAPVASWVDRIR